MVNKDYHHNPRGPLKTMTHLHRSLSVVSRTASGSTHYTTTPIYDIIFLSVFYVNKVDHIRPFPAALLSSLIVDLLSSRCVQTVSISFALRVRLFL